jgi:hypothetical protein
MEEFFGWFILTWILQSFGFFVRRTMRFLKESFSSTELLTKRGKKLKEIRFFDEENKRTGGVFIAVIVCIALIIF